MCRLVRENCRTYLQNSLFIIKVCKDAVFSVPNFTAVYQQLALSYSSCITHVLRYKSEPRRVDAAEHRNFSIPNTDKDFGNDA